MQTHFISGKLTHQGAACCENLKVATLAHIALTLYATNNFTITLSPLTLGILSILRTSCVLILMVCKVVAAL